MEHWDSARLASAVSSLTHFCFSIPKIKFHMKTGGQVNTSGTCPPSSSHSMRLPESLSVLVFH